MIFNARDLDWNCLMNFLDNLPGKLYHFDFWDFYYTLFFHPCWNFNDFFSTQCRDRWNFSLNNLCLRFANLYDNVLCLCNIDGYYLLDGQWRHWHLNYFLPTLQSHNWHISSHVANSHCGLLSSRCDLADFWHLARSLVIDYMRYFHHLLDIFDDLFLDVSVHIFDLVFWHLLYYLLVNNFWNLVDALLVHDVRHFNDFFDVLNVLDSHLLVNALLLS
mmetsp:Transcript_25911/g.41009  ORF Transcript_25911/g.41009 Transcript_25911/m.41009 type:complete len:218 (-) Transcript_25911:1526-2179(-)